jgi:hypothetical protein
MTAKRKAKPIAKRPQPALPPPTHQGMFSCGTSLVSASVVVCLFVAANSSACAVQLVSRPNTVRMIEVAPRGGHAGRELVYSLLFEVARRLIGT